MSAWCPAPAARLRFALPLAAAAVLLTAGSTPRARATERRAVDADQLRRALQAARPGDTIVLRNGTWRDLDLVFQAQATARAPVRLRAQTPGEVVLSGASRLTFQSPYLIAEGLLFRDGALPATGGAVVRFASHHGRLTDSALVDYNPADGSVEYAWVSFEGDDNRVDQSLFRGKNNRRPVITNRPAARRNRVDGCHFKDIAHHPENGREIVQIAGHGMSEELGSDGAFFTLERNLFEEAHGEAAEIVSIKSNRNVIRYNTFRKTRGGITNRSGNFNVIEGNFVLGQGEPQSYGIRVTGQYHRVVNNVVAGVAGACLLLVTGEYIDEALSPAWRPIQRAGTPLGRVPRYAQVKHGLFAHNSFSDCGAAVIEVGSSYRAGWPRGQQVLVPENNHLVDNQIQQPPGRPVIRVVRPDAAAPLDRFHFERNQIERNPVTAGPPPGARMAEGHAAADRLPQPAAQRRPLSARDVGPHWMRQRLMTSGLSPRTRP
jgi:poly(beta-D-mannuronate) lyase